MTRAFLFTGAGYTKNFGGFLADEMWSQIFNNPLIQSNSKLRDVMISESNYDYEEAFSNVMVGKNFIKNERDDMNTAVLQAYKNLDKAIIQTKERYNSVDFLKYIYPGFNDPSYYWFTLNQDLFLERSYGYRSPGMLSFSEKVQNHGFQIWNDSLFEIVPTKNIKKIVKNDINLTAGVKYIKLHGSYGWKSPDGSQKIAIGKNKHAIIKSMPLLSFYLKLFEEFISEGKKIAVIVGYGFRDEHINRILLNGVKKHDLKLIIISPQSPRNLEQQINYGHYYAHDILKKGLLGYMPVTLNEFISSIRGESVYLQQLKYLLQ